MTFRNVLANIIKREPLEIKWFYHSERALFTFSENTTILKVEKFRRKTYRCKNFPRKFKVLSKSFTIAFFLKESKLLLNCLPNYSIELLNTTDSFLHKGDYKFLQSTLRFSAKECATMGRKLKKKSKGGREHKSITEIYRI